METEPVAPKPAIEKPVRYAMRLPQNLLDNCRVLSSREDILPLLPKNITFCEVGVALGDYTAEVLTKCAVKTFIAIDIFVLHFARAMWGGRVDRELGDQKHIDYYKNRFRTYVDDGVMQVMVGDSALMLAQLDALSVDVFYLDANHSYENVKGELSVIKQIMKPDSIIIFNDYIMQDWFNNERYGVVQAANEFMIENDMEMIFFALARGMFCDVAIKKRQAK